jgi:outer membrane lipoprotein-sorting protein
MLVLLISAAPASALTGDEAVKKFQQRMNGIGTMSGSISWMHQSGQGYTGNFKFMAPGRVYIKFTSPSGRVLASNGKRLWVYDSSSNICGVQDLAKGGSGGIAALVNGYLAILTAQGPSGYTVKLKSAEKAYSDVTLVLDSSFLLKKAVLANKSGDGLTITLSGVRTGESMVPGMFDFAVPPNAQLVKNPLDVK